jgi:uncharacterized protein with PIN domain
LKKQDELYCPKCKNNPTTIFERYTKPIEEKRVWDGEWFQMVESNIDSVEYEELCAVCRTKLTYLPAKETDAQVQHR